VAVMEVAGDEGVTNSEKGQAMPIVTRPAIKIKNFSFIPYLLFLRNDDPKTIY
jgi:hypothetical protein